MVEAVVLVKLDVFVEAVVLSWLCLLGWLHVLVEAVVFVVVVVLVEA